MSHLFARDFPERKTGLANRAPTDYNENRKKEGEIFLEQIIRKIVITGGPCAGKTTAMGWIREAFTGHDYTVLFVPETATELITGGVAPWTCGTNVEYQECQVELQLKKEELFLRAARTMPGRKILIVCDRGVMDNRAYMNEEEFQRVLGYIDSTEEELLAGYDAVFHLDTAARGIQNAYTLANNGARIETPAQAVALDDKTRAAWEKHPYRRIIHSGEDFVGKMKSLIHEIEVFLGEE